MCIRDRGNITLDRINIIGEVKYTPRLAAASGRGPSPEAQDISVVTKLLPYVTHSLFY